MQEIAIQPRFIRVGLAPSYCAMNERMFNKYIRPHITEIPIGDRGIGIDRLELDKALDDYKARCGRVPYSKEHSQWQKAKQPLEGSNSSMASGISTSESTVSDFAKAAKRVTKKKPSKS